MARRDLRPAARARPRARGHHVVAPAVVGARVGRARHPTTRPSRPASWSASPASCRTPTRSSAACSTTSRETGDLENTLDHPLLRQRRERRGRRARLDQRRPPVERRDHRPPGAAGPHRRAGRTERPQQLPVGLDDGRQHAVQALEARGARGRRRRSVHRAPARVDPATQAAAGTIRHQFAHAIDILPTILEVDRRRGAARGSTDVDAVAHRRHEHAVRARTTPTRRNATRRSTSRCSSSRAIYHQGWKAVTFHALGCDVRRRTRSQRAVRRRRVGAVPRRGGHLRDGGPRGEGTGTPRRDDRPLVEEARRNDVLPLDNRPLNAILNPRPRPTGHAQPLRVPRARRARARGQRGAPAEPGAHDHRRRRDPVGRHGRRDHPRNGLRARRLRVLPARRTAAVRAQPLRQGAARRRRPTRCIAPGAHQVVYEYTKTTGLSGRGELRVDGRVVGAADIPTFTPMQFSNTGGGMTCGYELGPSVGDDYVAPFRCNAPIHRVDRRRGRRARTRPDGGVPGPHGRAIGHGGALAMQRLLRGVVAAALAGIALAGAHPAGAQTAGEHDRALRRAHRSRSPTAGCASTRPIAYDFGNVVRHGITRDLVARERYDGTYDRRYRISDVQVTADPSTPSALKTSSEGPFLHLRIGDPDRTITGSAHVSNRLHGARRAAHVRRPRRALLGRHRPPVGQCRSTRPSSRSGHRSITRVTCFAGPEHVSLPCGSRSRRRDAAGAVHPGAARAVLRRHDRRRDAEGHHRAATAADPRQTVERRPTHSRSRRSQSASRAACSCSGSRACSTSRHDGAATAASPARRSTPRWATRRARRSRGRCSAGSAGPVEFVPPEAIRPGQVGILLDEHANLLDVTASIVDLAVRGWLTITELEPTGLFHRHADYELSKKDAGKGELLPYEKKLLHELFKTGTTVKLSDLKYQFRASLTKIQDDMYDDAVKQGWFRVRPDKTRPAWTRGAVLVIVLGGGSDVPARGQDDVRHRAARGHRRRRSPSTPRPA